MFGIDVSMITVISMEATSASTILTAFSGVWCVVCGVWCVVCGVWCVVVVAVPDAPHPVRILNFSAKHAGSHSPTPHVRTGPLSTHVVG